MDPQENLWLSKNPTWAYTDPDAFQKKIERCNKMNQ